jgi:hypothetical protein
VHPARGHSSSSLLLLRVPRIRTHPPSGDRRFRQLDASAPRADGWRLEAACILPGGTRRRPPLLRVPRIRTHPPRAIGVSGSSMRRHPRRLTGLAPRGRVHPARGHSSSSLLLLRVPRIRTHPPSGDRRFRQLDASATHAARPSKRRASWPVWSATATRTAPSRRWLSRSSPTEPMQLCHLERDAGGPHHEPVPAPRHIVAITGAP